MLEGLRNEIQKIDRLTDYTYLKKHILLPALDSSAQSQAFSPLEHAILERAIHHTSLQAADIKDLFVGKDRSTISHALTRLREKKLLIPEVSNSRRYTIAFSSSILLRSIIKMLSKHGFLALEYEG